MIGKAYVFHHPQYGGLRVVKYTDVVFFCLEDLVAITDIGRDKLFPVLADTEGRVVEFYVAELTKETPKDDERRVFFSEAFGDAKKVYRTHSLAERNMIFVDSQVGRDMTIGCSNDPERKLFYKWVKNFILPKMEKNGGSWKYACHLVEVANYLSDDKPTDIRYAADGLYINGMRIN